MARIALIDPPGWESAVHGYRARPNTGIAYLVPTLRKHGHDVLVIDLCNEALTDAQVLTSLDEYHPDIIGFSVKNATMKSTRSLAQQVKNLLPKVPVILGGPQPTVAWAELVTEPWVDVVFIGEGEQVLPTICRYLTAGEPIEGLPGVVTKRNSQESFRLNRPLVADLDALPFPEYDLFPQNLKESLQVNYPLLTSRGCVYKCTYCCVARISGYRLRKRSTKSIIEELKWAKERYGVRRFEVIDDVFNLDLERCKEICRILIEEDLGLSWACLNGLRANCIDSELAELMYNSGCGSVAVGVESVEPAILATVKKGETIEDIERGIHTFQKAGMCVVGYFIVGLPGDSFELQERNVKFIKRMGIECHINMLVPYPGTGLWEWAKASARFLTDPEDCLYFADDPDKVKVVIETDDFPASERQRAYEMVNTRTRHFDVLLGQNLPLLQRYCRELKLMWDYDRVNLLLYLFAVPIDAFKRALVRIYRLPFINRSFRPIIRKVKALLQQANRNF